MRVGVLTTRRAPGLRELLAHPARGTEWELAVVLATDPDSPEPAAAASHGIATCVHDLGAFCASRAVKAGELAVRPGFDRATLAVLEPFRVDLLVLCGYLHIVTQPLLTAFPKRIVNVHDADLSVTGPDGLPRYRGLRSTREAVFAGEPETRSTVHLVTPEVDTGPPILRSWAFETHPLVDDARARNREDILKAYAYAQREWMMEAAWGALLGETVGHFARGEVRRLAGRVIVDGRLGPRDLDRPSSSEPVGKHTAALGAGGGVST